MFFLFAMYGVMPYLLPILWLALGWMWLCTGMTILGKLILSASLLGFSYKWWMGAGRELWSEFWSNYTAKSYTLQVPLNYNGVFAVIVQVNQGAPDTFPNPIVIPPSGIAIVQASQKAFNNIAGFDTKFKVTNGKRGSGRTHRVRQENLFYFDVKQEDGKVIDNYLDFTEYKPLELKTLEKRTATSKPLNQLIKTQTLKARLNIK